ncbi:methyltransferase domain-containing protein [Scleroderma citrinum]
MSPKKEHEVSRMASFIRDLLSQDSRHRSAQHVVDVGSGQGYLSRALKEQGLHVLALDSDESQTSSADKWRVKDSLRRAHEQRRAAFQNGCITAIRPPFPPAPTVSVENGSLTHRTVHIQQQSLEVAIVEWLHSGAHDISSPFQEPIPIVFVALHACGSLTVDILRTFLAQQDKTKNGSQRTWEPHSLVVVGCCYNLISPSDFPLSKSLRALSPPPTLPIAALHLATQVPAHWFRTERSGKDAYLAVRKVVYRALLHPVLLLAARYRRSHEARDDSENVRNGDGDETAVHLGLGETPGNRRLGKLNNTSYVNWATFLSCAVTKMDIDLPILVRHHLEGEPDTEDLLPPWILYNGHDGGDREQRSTQERLETESRLEVLHVLRCILGPLVETLILLDRYEWLRDELEAVEGESEVERKWKVDMINLFDQATGSGRNIALVVRPAPGQ